MAAKFVVFDGNEGCGKSTQAKLLLDHLQSIGVSAVAVRDPGSTRVGELIRSILLNPDHDELTMRCEMLLYMAARAQMMQEIVLPALAAGKWVIGDRFVSSTLAYQLGGDGLTADEIRTTAGVAIAGRWPDKTILLDMPVQESIARVTRAKDRIEQRPIEYHASVRENFLKQAGVDPQQFVVLNAAVLPAELHKKVLGVLGI